MSRSVALHAKLLSVENQAAATLFPRQPARAPLVPRSILEERDCFVATDTRFRAAARLLQACWREDAGLAVGLHISPDNEHPLPRKLGSRLNEADAKAGLNFVSADVFEFTRMELALREEGAVIDEERLFGNALSSMPLAFNLFAHAAMDPAGYGTELFRRLLPDVVHQLTGLAFEHSPGRRDPRYLSDGTAFDLAATIITTDGETATVFIELKYSEGFLGPVARHRPRYDTASRDVRLFRDPDSPLLRGPALEQLWREHMMAQLAVDLGGVDKAYFVVIGPHLSRRYRGACHAYRAELSDPAPKDDNRVPFRTIDLEDTVRAIGEAGQPDLALRLWRRYLDFGRIVDLILGRSPGAPASPAGASGAAPPAPEASTIADVTPAARRKAIARSTRGARGSVRHRLAKAAVPANQRVG